MAQANVTNLNGSGNASSTTVRGRLTEPSHPRHVDPENPKADDASGVSNQQQQHVRHIPIFVEGRDEPLINRNIDSPSSMSNEQQQQTNSKATAFNDIPKMTSTGGGSIFSRVKEFPVRKIVSDFELPNVPTAHRSASAFSAGHNIPINVVHSTSTQQKERAKSTPHSHQQSDVSNDQRQTSSPQPTTTAITNDPISKIQIIQQDVLELMDQVDNYKGESQSSKDKDYLYLDEMLTQNLLKLDTIDTDGNEGIKAARKEAIKCINQCIAVLEAKTEAAKQARQCNKVGNNDDIVATNSNIKSKDFSAA